jgi:hypothetical protein
MSEVKHKDQNSVCSWGFDGLWHAYNQCVCYFFILQYHTIFYINIYKQLNHVNSEKNIGIWTSKNKQSRLSNTAAPGIRWGGDPIDGDRKVLCSDLVQPWTTDAWDAHKTLSIYHLVMTNIAIERSTMLLIAKPSVSTCHVHPFSIVFLYVYQRVFHHV